jgi:23S rRNA (cytosine1962-C5)-methyltransferase
VIPYNSYELVDFGAGRKLERFGRILVDRPCPPAQDAELGNPAAWSTADARYERERVDNGRWLSAEGVPESWTIQMGSLQLELRTTASGQVGLFPEQSGNWCWLAKQIRSMRETVALAGSPQHAGRQDNSALPAESDRTRLSHGGESRISILNLFAYTGVASLSAAAAGAAVVHVDGSRSAVAWARHNARLSGLGDAPIRWIVEDVARFVRREVRRGTRYDGIILDPPSYGHGPKGEVWKIDRQLNDLLHLCAELVPGAQPLLLLTAHTPGLDGTALRRMLSANFRQCAPGRLCDRPLYLKTRAGRLLASGAMARWPD